MFQQALENSEAIDVLVNVLEADDQKCKVAALRLLQQLVTVQHFQRLLVLKSGIATIVRLLSEPERDVRCLAAVTLANAVNNHRSRMLTRKAGAVPLLVSIKHKLLIYYPIIELSKIIIVLKLGRSTGHSERGRTNRRYFGQFSIAGIFF